MNRVDEPASSAFYRGHCSKCKNYPVATVSFLQLNLEDYAPHTCIVCLLEQEIAQPYHQAWLLHRHPAYCETRLLRLIKLYRRIASGFMPLDGAHPAYLHGRFYKAHQRAQAFYCETLCEWTYEFFKRFLVKKTKDQPMISVDVREPFSSTLWFEFRVRDAKRITLIQWWSGGETIAILRMIQSSIEEIDGLFKNVVEMCTLAEKIFY